ncbi:MAG: fluoride efflux transporter CrcB, partial [Alphaproteobacteria bacterium]|nr:fluoride efflux transporter CrcB [Alphaproteobacteria bacterium]
MTLRIFMAVAAGGAIGSMGRYLVSMQALKLFGTAFPWGTMSVNVIGSFIMGAVVELMTVKWNVSEEVRNLVLVGILGGFTTFSSFSLDFVRMMEKQQVTEAFIYLAGSIMIGVSALLAGFSLLRWVSS